MFLMVMVIFFGGIALLARGSNKPNITRAAGAKQPGLEAGNLFHNRRMSGIPDDCQIIVDPFTRGRFRSKANCRRSPR